MADSSCLYLLRWDLVSATLCLRVSKNFLSSLPKNWRVSYVLELLVYISPPTAESVASSKDLSSISGSYDEVVIFKEGTPSKLLPSLTGLGTWNLLCDCCYTSSLIWDLLSSVYLLYAFSKASASNTLLFSLKANFTWYLSLESSLPSKGCPW